MKRGSLVALGSGAVLAVQAAWAHCPLCTVGAAAAAGGAAYLGVNNAAIGVFIGGFGASMGWWFARLMKKEYLPFQTAAWVLSSFLLTVIPIRMLFPEAWPLFISWLGEYGSTFAINLFLLGSVVGGIILCSTPWLSERLTALRSGKHLPFQGMILTVVLLVVTSAVLQLVF